MPNPKDAVEALRDKLDTDERGECDRDRDLLLEFSDQLKLLREDYGWHRHEKLLRHNVRVSENADVHLHETLAGELDSSGDEAFQAAKDAAETAVRWIHDTYDIDEGSQETNRDYRVAFRLFAKHVTRGDEIPDSHNWISTKTSRNYDPEPDEADMLDWDGDTVPMIEAARNARDEALIALQFEGGFRGGELFDMRCSDLSDGEHSLKVRVDGKRGEHDVHLIKAVPYVQNWLSEHPGGGDDYLWTKLSTAERFSYQRFLQCFRASADRAGVTKPVTPTNFRKSNAYWLAADRGKSQAFIEDRQGRARGSPVISRYVAKFSGVTQEKEYAAMHGIEIEEEDEDVTPPVTCPRCGGKTPADLDFCKHCHQTLDMETKQLLDAVSERLDEEAVEAVDTDARRQAIEARRRLRNNPNALGDDGLHELVSSIVED